MKNWTADSALGMSVLLVEGLLCGCGRPVAEAPPAPPAPVLAQAVSPKRGSITRSVTLPGEIKPYQQATLYAKVAGYLKTITVDKGDAVREGALLAEIEVPELVADLDKYKAEAEVAEIDYKRLSES
jgi:multidrug efflux pump subunit AcrA (membrane-fusion protein)